MRYRRSVLVGLVALGAGIVAIVAPGAIPLSPDRAVVSVIGLLALVQALRVVQRRRDATLDEAKTPDPERSITTSQPGTDLGSVLAQFLERRGVDPHFNRIREGLSTAAVTVLTRFDGVTETDATERVAAGTWTDDVYAAAFLGDTDAPSVPRLRRIRDKLAGESPSQRKIRRTVDAITAIAEPRLDSNGPETHDPEHRDDEGRTSGEANPERRPSTKDWVTFDEETDEALSRAPHSTEHWRGVSVIALVGIGIGVLVEQPAVLLGGVVGIGYAAYARSSALPPGSVSVDRTLDTETPDVGEEVTVTLTVTNAADRLLPDLRIVDGVPAALSVTSGSPRCGTALRPGDSETITYTVTARRGEHRFGPTLVVGRNLSGSTEAERHYDSGTTLTCLPALSSSTEPMPLRQQAARYGGRERTATTGDGIEFAATREYRPGDPMRRIDWNRRARTRELTTVEFREERAATVVLLIDARSSAYVAPDPAGGHAVDRAVAAARDLFGRIEDDGNRVGIAVAGSNDCWLAPDAGADHRAAARELLAVDPAVSTAPKSMRDDDRRWHETLGNRLETGTQIVFLTPLADDTASHIARQFDERGFPVTVVSPDPTTDGTSSQRLARVARQLQVSTLRAAGVPVVDWGWSESLDAALARHGERRVK